MGSTFIRFIKSGRQPEIVGVRKSLTLDASGSFIFTGTRRSPGFGPGASSKPTRFDSDAERVRGLDRWQHTPKTPRTPTNSRRPNHAPALGAISGARASRRPDSRQVRKEPRKILP